MLYLEDIKVGEVHEFGRYEVTRDEVIEFAKRYDPQPFHLSDEAASKTHFGRIAASGWHTCAMMMAMLVQYATERQIASLGSPGVDELRWKKPVYPGDILRARMEMLEVRPSRSRPEMGTCLSLIEVFNQNDQLVMTLKSPLMVATSPKI